MELPQHGEDYLWKTQANIILGEWLKAFSLPSGTKISMPAFTIVTSTFITSSSQSS